MAITLLVLGAGVLLAGGRYGWPLKLTEGFQHPFHARGDAYNTGLVVTAMAYPSNFSRDIMAGEFERVYGNGYYAWLARLVRRGTSLDALARGGYLTWNLLFLAGCYALARFAGLGRRAGIVHAGIALGVFHDPLSQQGLQGHAWGFIPAWMMTSRGLVYGCVPWLIAGWLRWRAGWGLAAVYGAAGLLTQFHPFAAAHLLAVMVAAVVIVDGRGAFTRTHAAAVIVGGLCMLPAILRSPLAGLAAHPDRYPYATFPSWPNVMEAGLWMGVAGLGGWLGARTLRRETPHRALVRPLAGLCAGAALVTGLGLLAVALAPAAAAMQPQRASVYVFLPLNLMASAGIAAMWRQGGLRRAAAAILVLLFWNTATLYDVRRAVLPRRPVPAVTVARPAPPEEAWVEFLELCAWARTSASPSALFLTPPDFNLFRLYAQRSLVAVGNLDGFVASYAGSRAAADAWRERLTRIRAAYAASDHRRLRDVARRYGAEYLIGSALGIPSGRRPVFRNRVYAVWNVAT